jgi:hypothetical protein
MESLDDISWRSSPSCRSSIRSRHGRAVHQQWLSTTVINMAAHLMERSNPDRQIRPMDNTLQFKVLKKLIPRASRQSIVEWAYIAPIDLGGGQ